MKSADLNKNWKIITESGERTGDLPFDALVGAERDYSCAFGEMNGYFPAAKLTLVKELPVSGGKARLVISGACGYGDVYVNDGLVCKLHSYAPVSADITEYLCRGRNILRIEMFSAPGMADKYTGLGIAGGVRLITEDDVDIIHGTPFVKTAVVGGKTYADVTVAVRNDGPAGKFTIDCTVTNARGKRCGKKQRKVYLRAETDRVFVVRVRILRAYEWGPTDPYMYDLAVRVIPADGGAEKQASARFGIVARALNPLRGLYLNGKNITLYGAYMAHTDAALGGISSYCNERRKLEALKALGYNAVHLVECPTEATLSALDDVGMYAFVDIFPYLSVGKAPLDGHIFVEDGAADGLQQVYDSVTALRNHPSVVIYGVADDVPECYGRNGGHAAIAAIAKAIRELDDTRPVTVSAHEFVPNIKELADVGTHRALDDQAAINVGREKNLFDTLTEGAFAAVDICGFNNLYPLYGTEKLKRGRLLMGSRTDENRAFESVDETEKNAYVVGDFGACGIDYPGGGIHGEIYNMHGDLDALCNAKPQGVMKSLILEAPNIAYIAVLDPDTDEPVHMWNWPRYLGQTVTVCVYTSGDVVALYLDGRLLGRKLAGKINRHVATFKTEYFPGKLEAVCYLKGAECARAELKTANSPKSVKLSAYGKNLSLSRGDYGFVYVDVCDRDGYIVPYAMRNLTAQVTGGSLVAFINADPMLRKTEHDVCPAYEGKALAVVKPDGNADGKTVVKITGEGLLSSKISFKVKD